MAVQQRHTISPAPSVARAATPRRTPNKFGWLFAGLWVIAFGIGLAGLVTRLLTGHEYANYTSAIPWGLWVASYIYFVGLSAGAFLISALVYVFGVKRLEPIGKLALFTALIALISALLTIWLDLGHEWRFYRVFTAGNPGSMMAWMVWLYTAYAIVLTAELWFAIRGDLVEHASENSLRGRASSFLLGRWGSVFGARPQAGPKVRYDRTADMRRLRVLGSIGVPLAVAFHGGVGALFGVIGAREYWNSPIFPVLFITGALVSGGALLTAIVAFFWPRRGSAEHRDMVEILSKLTLALLAVYLIMMWAEFSISLYAGIPAGTEPFKQMMTGPYAWVFWIFQVGLGAVVPIILLLARPRSVPIVGVASFLIAACFLATRLNVVIPGLLEPPLKGLDTAYVEAGLSYEYFPSLMEFSVLLFVVTLGLGLFYLGFKLLPLTNEMTEEAS